MVSLSSAACIPCFRQCPSRSGCSSCSLRLLPAERVFRLPFVDGLAMRAAVMLIRVVTPRETITTSLASCYQAEEFRNWSALCLYAVYFAAVAYQARFVARRLDGANGCFARVGSRGFGLFCVGIWKLLAAKKTDLSSDLFSKGLWPCNPINRRPA